MKNVIILRDGLSEELSEKVQKAVESYGYACCFFQSQEEAGASDKCEDCEILYGQATRILDKLPNLKLLHLGSAGNDAYINHPYLKEETILSNSSGAFGVSISEHLVMNTLMLLRKMKERVENQNAHEWKKPEEIYSIINSTVGVVGTGDIAQEYVRRIKGFLPKKILGFNRSGVSGCDLFDTVATLSHLDDYLPDIDILGLAVPKTPETNAIINKERLAKMKPTAVLLNVGRGNAVDEDALADALLAHQIAGASLDVFQKEPLAKDSRLWDMDTLIITPHISGNMTLEYTRQRNVEIFLDQLERYCMGKPLINVVDRSKWY